MLPDTQKKWLPLAAFFLFLVCVLPSMSLAQVQPNQKVGGDCDTCGQMDRGYGMEHSFWNLTGCTEGGDCYDCHAFNACHGNWQASECRLLHWACGTTAMLYKAARDLARTGVSREQLAGNQEAAQLRVNAKRAMIQVLNCDGAVVAQFRMSRDALARFARSPEGTASVIAL